MRKVEQQMLRAIDSETSWSGGNTTVIVRPNDVGGNDIIVVLHGNEIARRVKRKWFVTLAGWNSKTTRSRHNALHYVTGMSFSQKDFEPYLNGALVNDTEWYSTRW